MPPKRESASVELKDLPACDPQTVAPLAADGSPDLYNYMPTRFVPKHEAKARGWPLFYEGALCRYGHQAPRYLSNPRLCVDCKRIKAGKALIGTKNASLATYTAERPYKQRQPAPTSAAPAGGVLAPLQPDRQEKRFLEEYADVRDFDEAARRIGVSPSLMQGRLSWSAPFKDAVAELENRLGIRPTPPLGGAFEWDADKRARLLEVLIDTGDMATARDAIRVTPSQFFKEVERNPQFASDLEAALPLAAKALEERATQLALAGNDKLLTKILSAKLPEYREHVKVDLNVTEKLTDAQLDNRLNRLIGKYAGRIIDADFTDHTDGGDAAPRQIEAPADAGGNRASGSTQSLRDLL